MVRTWVAWRIIGCGMPLANHRHHHHRMETVTSKQIWFVACTRELWYWSNSIESRVSSWTSWPSWWPDRAMAFCCGVWISFTVKSTQWSITQMYWCTATKRTHHLMATSSASDLTSPQRWDIPGGKLLLLLFKLYFSFSRIPLTLPCTFTWCRVRMTHIWTGHFRAA